MNEKTNKYKLAITNRSKNKTKTKQQQQLEKN